MKWSSPHHCLAIVATGISFIALTELICRRSPSLLLPSKPSLFIYILFLINRSLSWLIEGIKCCALYRHHTCVRFLLAVGYRCRSRIGMVKIIRFGGMTWHFKPWSRPNIFFFIKEFSVLFTWMEVGKKRGKKIKQLYFLLFTWEKIKRKEFNFSFISSVLVPLKSGVNGGKIFFYWININKYLILYLSFTFHSSKQEELYRIEKVFQFISFLFLSLKLSNSRTCLYVYIRYC